MSGKKISVVIPTLNAEREIENLIECLLKQTLVPDEIIVIDSESEDNTVNNAKKYPCVKVIQIERKQFNHGGTRNKAFYASNGDYVLFLTQDALPYNEYYIANLLAYFDNDEKIAMVSGCQVPRDDANKIEKLTRSFNYPTISNIRSDDDLEKYGVKTFFFSDVCSAYKRSVFEELGGFDDDLNTNEDMLIAAKAIFAGYKVGYCAEAKVIHSHNFTLKEQFNRNRQVGHFFSSHESFFAGISSEKEGVKMVKYVIVRLLKKGAVFSVVYFVIQSAVKLLGYKIGYKKGI